MSPGNADPRIGTKIAGRYEISSLLGKGGMGMVYRAVHIATHRPIAVKLLGSDADDSASRRFFREARIAAKLSHPNLVDVIDVGKIEDGGMFLALELLEGETLASHLRRKRRMRPEDALDVMVPILDALSALHEAGVVHRDVKPSNIFLSLDGTSRIVPKLLDLGVSKPLEPHEALTDTGMMLGTPYYMSPEQATGATDIGFAADIWATGVVLFEIITGDRPFEAATIPGLLHKIATDRPPRISDRARGLPRAVAAAIDRALAYEPSSRPASAVELADALVGAAMDAGWTLTCRMPSGPRISLAPFTEPVLHAGDLTPILGSATPRAPTPQGMEEAGNKTREVPPPLAAQSLSTPDASAGIEVAPTERATPRPEAGPSEVDAVRPPSEPPPPERDARTTDRGSAAKPAAITRDGPRPDGASGDRASGDAEIDREDDRATRTAAPIGRDIDPAASASQRRTSLAAQVADRPREREPEAEPDQSTSPSTRVRQLSRSPIPIALGAIAVVATIGVAVWMATRASEDPSAQPEREAALAAIGADPPAIDAGASIAEPPPPAIVEPPPEPPVEVAVPPPASRRAHPHHRVEWGNYGSPIIED